MATQTRTRFRLARDSRRWPDPSGHVRLYLSRQQLQRPIVYIKAGMRTGVILNLYYQDQPATFERRWEPFTRYKHHRFRLA